MTYNPTSRVYDAHLKPGSLMIAAGTANIGGLDGLNLPATDLDGAPFPIGAIRSVGAYAWPANP